MRMTLGSPELDQNESPRLTPADRRLETLAKGEADLSDIKPQVESIARKALMEFTSSEKTALREAITTKVYEMGGEKAVIQDITKTESGELALHLQPHTHRRIEIEPILEQIKREQQAEIRANNAQIIAEHAKLSPLEATAQRHQPFINMDANLSQVLEPFSSEEQVHLKTALGLQLAEQTQGPFVIESATLHNEWLSVNTLSYEGGVETDITLSLDTQATLGKTPQRLDFDQLSPEDQALFNQKEDQLTDRIHQLTLENADKHGLLSDEQHYLNHALAREITQQQGMDHYQIGRLEESINALGEREMTAHITKITDGTLITRQTSINVDHYRERFAQEAQRLALENPAPIETSYAINDTRSTIHKIADSLSLGLGAQIDNAYYHTKESINTSLALSETMLKETPNWAIKLSSNVAGTAFGVSDGIATAVKGGSFDESLMSATDTMKGVRDEMVDRYSFNVSDLSQQRLSESYLANIAQSVSLIDQTIHDTIQTHYGDESAHLYQAMKEPATDLIALTGLRYSPMGKAAQNYNLEFQYVYRISNELNHQIRHTNLMDKLPHSPEITLSMGNKEFLINTRKLNVEMTPSQALMDRLPIEQLGADYPLTFKEAADIIAIPKGQRPDPSTYLSKEYINKHLSQFDEGASRIVTERAFYKHGLGKPDHLKSEFVSTNQDIDLIIKNANGNIGNIAKEIGINPSQLRGEGDLMRVQINSLKDNLLKIPSGNEFGANNKWIPGGRLPTGKSEAIVSFEKAIKDIDYEIFKLSTGNKI